MDTDDLSNEAYKGIIVEAKKFNHDLTLQFGLLADSCKNEEEYLTKVKKLIKAIPQLEEYELDDMFFGSPPDKKQLFLILEKNINQHFRGRKNP